MNILITGGASGLGAAITKKLATDTANKIYFTYCSSSEAAKQLETEFANAEGIPCNFLEKADIELLINKIDSMGLDVLINNAIHGLTQAHFHKLSPDTFMDSFSHNVQPTLLITQKAISLFRKKKFGKIITILTSAILKPPIGMSEYVANKAYLASMSRSWAIENARFNVASNCLSPSVMRTDLTKDIYEKIFDELESKHPLKKLLTPEEVATEISALVHSSQYINGTNRIMNSAEDVI